MQTFEEVRNRTPADPNKPAPEATLPQPAWDAVLRDAVQGLRPPYTPQSPAPMASGHPPPGLGHWRPPLGPTTTTPGEGRARARGGQGTERDTQARGRGRAPSEGQTPIGTGHRKRHNVGAGNHPRTRKGQVRGPRRRERGHHGRRQDPHPWKGIPRRRDQRRLTPADPARVPAAHTPNTRRQSTNQTPYRTHQRTPTSHPKPHRRWRAHLQGRNGLNPQRKPLGHHRPAYHHALTAR